MSTHLLSLLPDCGIAFPLKSPPPSMFFFWAKKKKVNSQPSYLGCYSGYIWTSLSRFKPSSVFKQTPFIHETTKNTTQTKDLLHVLPMPVIYPVIYPSHTDSLSLTLMLSFPQAPSVSHTNTQMHKLLRTYSRIDKDCVEMICHL